MAIGMNSWSRARRIDQQSYAFHQAPFPAKRPMGRPWLSRSGSGSKRGIEQAVGSSSPGANGAFMGRYFHAAS
jgi:hypothetical protein